MQLPSECGMFVAVFAEFLSDKINIHIMVFEVNIFAKDMQHCYGSMVSTRLRRDMLAIMMTL
ncbi:hypothetical protein KY285_020814 [Solanum tuberosum]|nr:hypothetical protein KY285_020814 [Solanum tuberosum]